MLLVRLVGALVAFWNGDLPPSPDTGVDNVVSGCTFSLGPPGPPSTALCASFTAHCRQFRDDLKSKHIHTLKSNPMQSQDRDNPLANIAFRSGCTGDWTSSSDGSYLSAYTATCIVDGTDWIPFVFEDFLQNQFGLPDGSRSLDSAFIGCQVPAHA